MPKLISGTHTIFMGGTTIFRNLHLFYTYSSYIISVYAFCSNFQAILGGVFIVYKFGVFGSGGKSKHAVSSFENPLYDVGPTLSLATNDENNASGSGYMDVGGNGAGNGYMDVSVNNAADVDDDGQ